jgi:predicted permease
MVPPMLAETWLLLGALVPVFTLVAVGWCLHRFGLVSDQGVEDLNSVVYWAALPVQLFVLVAGVDTRHFFDPVALAATLGGFAIGLLGSWVLTSHLPPAVRGSIVAGVARPNAAFIGLPVVQLLAATMPADQAAALLTAYGVLLGAMITSFNVGSVMALRLAHHGLTAVGVLHVLGHLPRNPLIVACALGTLSSLIRPGLFHGTLIGNTLALQAGAAVPMALLLVGMQLDLRLMRRNHALLAAITVGKLVLVPALTWGLGLAFGIAPLVLTAAVVLMACPVAIASVPMARLLGGDAELMAAMVVTTTIAAPLAMLGWLLVLH